MTAGAAPAPSLGLRIVRKAVTLVTLLPLYADFLQAAAARGAKEGLRSGRRKLMLLLAALAAFVALLLTGHPLWAALMLLVPAFLLGPRVGFAMERSSGMRRLAGQPLPLEGVPAARDMLRLLGLTDTRADALAAEAASGREVLLAALDQDNRFVSAVGPIPYFSKILIVEDQFIPRIRHKMELVIVRGVVAVRKAYNNRTYFVNEALALHALRHVPEVPRIVSFDQRALVLHQTFMPGQNLGTLMAEHGSTVETQWHSSLHFYEGDHSYAGWEQASKDRLAGLQALASIGAPGLVANVGRLLERVHQCGVVIRDIKFGNVLLHEGKPYFCDFDSARVYGRNSQAFLDERLKDREEFNYHFGGTLVTRNRYGEPLTAFADAGATPTGRPVYFGFGLREGRMGAIAEGSGRWPLIAPHLPDLRGRKVLDLGCDNGVLSLEMLRAGAARVTAGEADPRLAERARLNHRRFELVDNRDYDFELADGGPQQWSERDWSGYDVATAYYGVDDVQPEWLDRMIQAISRRIPLFVVQGSDRTRDLLRRNGFPHQRVIPYYFYGRPLIIASTTGLPDRDGRSSN